MGSSVLVGYATHHGATRDIAERIATRLRGHGITADVRSVAGIRDVGAYDAFVIGSAVYELEWLTEAHAFIHRHRSILGRRPTWLFSSGPLGPAAARLDAAGAAVQPRGIANVISDVHARGHRVFGGAYDPDAAPVGLVERFIRLMPAARDALPAGDFRDWDAIDAWADGIAAWLRPVAAGDEGAGDG